ncbi:MAG: hypothetical protein MJA82_08485 [Clostridia bacterium]|nr:hypothetical protein [Clostridia bacterium]
MILNHSGKTSGRMLEKIKKRIVGDRGSFIIVQVTILIPILLMIYITYFDAIRGWNEKSIMQIAAWSGTRVYANPIEDRDMKSMAIAEAQKILGANGVFASVEAFESGEKRYVLIEKPWALRYPMKIFTLRSGGVLHVEPIDK